MTQIFERKLSPGNLNKLRLTQSPWNEESAAPRSRVRQQIFGALPNGLQIGERRPLINGGCDPCICSAPLIFVSPGPRNKRAKSGGGHWGELPVSAIACTGRRRSVLGNHLARTCLLNHADPCCWWTRPPPRKHEAGMESSTPFL